MRAASICSHSLQKRVRPTLASDRRVGTVSRIYTRLVAEHEEHVANRCDQRGVVAAWQIGSSNRPGKQRVAHEQIESALAGTRDLDAHAARAMPRRVMNARLEIAERNPFVDAVEAVDRWRRIDRQPEQTALLHRTLVEEQIVPVQVNGCAECAFRSRDAGDMIDVRVCQENVRDLHTLLRDELEEAVHFIARVDEHPGSRARTGDDEAVLVERTDRLRLDYDHLVILAILDDLLFTSKIRSAAHHAGATVSVARSAANALAQMQADVPALVILDLNNPRTDPLGVIAAMKADRRLAQVPTVGFVSHVDGATIDAARAAGVGTVLARSAFVTQLPALLASGPRA